MANFYFKYGAMEAGKTTALLQAAYNYTRKGMNIIVIKSSTDKKGDDTIVSRLGISRKVDYLIEPDEKILDRVKLDNLDCILVDEVQFMTPKQVKELWLIAQLRDIPVVCYGLKTTFKGEFFIGSKPAMELADVIEELPIICSCGSDAKFNARKINGEFVVEGAEVAIDGQDAEYESLCGKCYIQKVLKITKI